MADAKAIRRSASVAQNRKANVVIVSATYGTTNQLLELIDIALAGNENKRDQLFNDLYNRHLSIAQALELSDEDSNQVHELLLEIKALAKGITLLGDYSFRAKDNLLSHGERLSSIFMQKALSQCLDQEVLLVDARKIIATNNHYGSASPMIEKTAKQAEQHLVPLLKSGKVIVSQGFIGLSEEGYTSTLGRGGSDYSASLFAEAIGAKLVEIWTDVAGIASTDPRLCNNAKPLKEITYKEACELATFGAKVLHPTSLWPAMRKNIPVYVGSSMEPEKQGTKIVLEAQDKPLVRAIALRRKQSLLTITTPRMVNTHGFLQNVFRVFAEHEISVDLVTTSEISVAITMNESSAINESLLQALSEIGEVEQEKDLALISLVGTRISNTAGLSKEIFTQLADINVRMICQGASASNICFLIEENHAEDAVKMLHRRFLESEFANS